MNRLRSFLGAKWFRHQTDAGALVALAGLVALTYRRHLAGSVLYLGNFDRLNSFLNTLLFHVQGWKTGHFSAWDDSMFMGRNTFALPFTFPNALNRLVALFPLSSFYWISGYVSIGLLVLAGWSAYVFIADVVGDRFAAFVGAALYQFSALAILKVSQNDMSFAVLIQIPWLLWLARGIEPQRWRGRFVALCLILTHLLFFCFLQKAAYAVLLLGAYVIYLSVRRRTVYPLVVAAAAGAVALIAAFPRIYGIAQEMGQLQRLVAPGFNMHDFDALYTWQGFQHVDALRWFSDGLFGRYFGEMEALHNHLNVTEGMLLFTGTLVPFVVLGGLMRWGGQWFGIFRRPHREMLFYYTVIAAVFAVVACKQAYRVLFELFLRVDFTHTRVVIAALPLLCALTAARLGQLRPSPVPGFLRRAWLAVSATLVAILLQAGLEKWAARTSFASPVPLTSSWGDLADLGRATAGHLLGSSPPSGPLRGEVLIRMLPSAPGEILLSALLVAALFGGLRLIRAQSILRWWGYVLFGALLVNGAWRFADFQVNGAQIRTSLPFADNNSYAAAPDEFTIPSAGEISRLHARLESDAYRTAFYGTGQLPLFVSPHLGAFWQLRQVAGYSSGVPQRLAALPWPPGPLGLRTLTFGSLARSQDLPWPLLAFLNVKYAVRPSVTLYKNLPADGSAAGDAVAGVKPEPNPLPVVPRVFFARRARVVAGPKAALAAISSGGDSPRFIDPVDESVVESAQPLPALAGGGEIHADFAGDEIELIFPPVPESRLLVLDELYHPDWKATAGGRPLAVLPANLVMRAVVVPAGASRVSMRFEPFCRARNILFALALAGALAAVVVRSARRFAWLETASRHFLAAYLVPAAGATGRFVDKTVKRRWQLLLVVLAYLAGASALLVRSHGLPYGSDGNETFSSAIHARNLSQFPWRLSYGLTDESYGVVSAAHPFIHSHQGNFPRLFTYGLYVLGAHSVEAQVAATAFTIGLAAMVLAFFFLSRAASPAFAVVGCFVFISDYFLFGQWHLNTYRVWHCFFFFSSLGCGLAFCRRPSRRIAVLTVLNFACLCYWEYVFAFFVLGVTSLYAAILSRRRLLAFFALQIAGGLTAAGVLGWQLAAYMGWGNVRQDITYTLYARNSALDPSFVARATAFYAQHKVLWWPNYVDAAPLRHLGVFFTSLLQSHLEYYTPWLAFLMVFSALGWLLTPVKMGRPWGRRLLLVGGVLILAGWWAVRQSALFDWNPAPLWHAAGWPGGLWQRAGLDGMAILVILLIALGPDLVGYRRIRTAASVLAFLGAGLVAYGVTYRVFTGYIYSGYLNRQAPFLVFLSDPLLALAFYLPISTLAAAWTRWKWSRRKAAPAGGSRGMRWLWAATAAGGVSLALAVGWGRLQREYFRAVPPDRYDFIKRLAQPPYRHASFVVNTYAAPVAVETQGWAYLEPSFFGGILHLTRTGFQLSREDTYKWFADFGANPAYEKPAYALIVRPTGWSTVLASYLHAHGAASSAQAPLGDSFGLMQRAASPFSAFLHYQVAETDPDHERDGFGIIRLDWDYPAYLRPLLADESAPSAESAPSLDQEWLIEVQTVPTSPSAGKRGTVRLLTIATEREREHINLATGTLHDDAWVSPDPTGQAGSFLEAPAGIPARLEATVGGEYLYLNFLKGPDAGRVRLMVNDLVGEVDLHATKPGVQSVRFSAAGQLGDTTTRPRPIPGEYVALRRAGAGLQLAYQFCHQENLAEEDTRIDFAGRDALGRWGAVQTVVLLGKTGVPVDLFAFIKLNPDTMAEYNRVREQGDPRAYLQWLSDYFSANSRAEHRPGVLGAAALAAAPASADEPPVRHVLLPLPASTAEFLMAWVRPGTRTKLGPLYPSNALALAGAGQGRPPGAAASAFEDSPPLSPLFGSLELDLKFPSGRWGQSEPLVTTGVTGAGDFVYVAYVDPHHVRIGFDHWGIGGFLSPPLPADYQSAHHLRISFGSLFPPDRDPRLRGLSQAQIDALKNRVSITLDEKVALDVEAESFEAEPASVTVGKNRIGGSTAGPQFTGQILRSGWSADLRVNEARARARP